jgi:hypothetical protein
MPSGLEGFGVAVVDDKLYAIGGYTSTYSSDILAAAFGPITTPYATNEQYTPFGYGTVLLAVTVVSPQNRNYTSSSVSLIFTVNKPALWMGISLDGQETTAVTGNTTLQGLSFGLHNVTVYAKDEFGNTGASETVNFTVAKQPEPEPKPFPTTLVATASGASVAVIVIGLLIYFKKRRR